MKKLFAYFVIVSVLCLSPCSLPAETLFQQVGIASSPNPVGSGARAIGMGGAFIGVADDATAASWNPAGLIWLEKPEVSIVGDYSLRKEEIYSSQRPEINNTARVDHTQLNYFSIAYPFHFHRNMIVSLNYQRLYDFKRSFTYRRNYFSSSLDLEQYIDYQQSGFVGALGLAAAVQITPKISLGLTLNLWTEKLLWQNGWEESYKEHSIGTIGGLKTTIDTQIDHSYSDFSGLNGNIGVLWNITYNFTVGAVFKSPFTASIKHEYRIEQVQTFGQPFITNDQEDVELDMPLSYGLGFSWRFSDTFTVDIDLYRTQWSDYILTDGNGNEFSPIDGRPKSYSNVKDTTQLRMGCEYLFILEEKDIVIPIRTGIFYDPEPSEGSPKDFYGFSLGSGIVYKKLIFDMAYQFRWGDDVDTGNSIATSDADISQHLFLASLIFHF